MNAENEITTIANRASIKIIADAESLAFKHELRWNDSSLFGIIIFFCGGVFLTVIPFVKTSDTFSKIGGVILGSLFIVASILTIIKISRDYFSIVNNRIAFRYNLKSHLLFAKNDFKIKMNAHQIMVRSRSRRSKFIIVSHYLQTPNKEFIIFRFQMKQAEETDARKLGKAMTALLNERLASNELTFPANTRY
ncbi:MAG: hypothetical protein EOO46_15755 [Flavobacterium sp.]|nr:MAG: hypothetical protein EOO46_15755 [Flavobacterium sp.]